MAYLLSIMKPADWDQVAKIYFEGIKTGNATFQTVVPTWAEWDKGHLEECRIVAKNGDMVLGWIALSPVSRRCVYRGVAEVSVYVGENHRGKGIASALMSELIDYSEKKGIWTLQSGIFVENIASIELHKKYGFRVLGVREKIGRSAEGIWRDVVFLERRSKVVGI